MKGVSLECNVLVIMCRVEWKGIRLKAERQAGKLFLQSVCNVIKSMIGNLALREEGESNGQFLRHAEKYPVTGNNGREDSV